MDKDIAARIEIVKAIGNIRCIEVLLELEPETSRMLEVRSLLAFVRADVWRANAALLVEDDEKPVVCNMCGSDSHIAGSTSCKHTRQ